ncbi:glycosyltransferase family 2 protein [Enterobacter ludwigii]|uniref:glycosyltransferase family 2 protein n=1 Tax=Enterobacter ludwigii TaxID=299767 RepID=UPI0040695D5A
MNTNDIKISIITPTFNSASTILQTYNSISEQTHHNWEWLVTDDCSSDNTISIMNAICEKDSRVKLFKNAVKAFQVQLLQEITHWQTHQGIIYLSLIVMTYGLLQNLKNNLILCLPMI